jgi:hypothetical protein
MTIRTPISAEQNTWFDSQKVVSTSLSKEQEYNRTIQSGIVNNHIGTGVLPETLDQKVLFDSEQYLAVHPGSLDGKPIAALSQPTDTVNGSQIEISLVGTKIYDRRTVKICVIGQDVSNNLVYETFTFRQNEVQVGKRHFRSIQSILFNDLVGDSATSFNLLGSGKVIIREAKPLTISRSALAVSQDVYPDLFFRDFYADIAYGSLQNLLIAAAPAYDIYSSLHLAPKGVKKLAVNDITTQIGQKFLAKTNNLQKLTLLLSVDDIGAPVEEDYTWTGELSLSIYKLQTEVACQTDFIPELLIDYPPANIPLVQINLSYNFLADHGILLTSVPQPVEIALSSSQVGNSLRNLITPNQHYLFAIKRSGDASTNNIYVAYGDAADGDQRLSTFNTSTWVDAPEDSLWFKLHSDAIKVVDGQFYDSGIGAAIEKTTADGTATLDYTKDYISFSKFQQQIATIAAIVSPTSYAYDEKTGNQVAATQQFIPEVSLISSTELSTNYNTTDPLVIGAVADLNTQTVSIKDLAYPITLKNYSIVGNNLFVKQTLASDGYLDPAFSTLETFILNNSLVGSKLRIVSGTNKPYRIGQAEVICNLCGDINGDGVIDSKDVNNIYSYKDFNYLQAPSTTSQITTTYSGQDEYATLVQSSYAFHTTPVSVDGYAYYYVVKKPDQGGVANKIIEKGYAALSPKTDASKGVLVAQSSSAFANLIFNDPETSTSATAPSIIGYGNGAGGLGNLLSKPFTIQDMSGWKLTLTSPVFAAGDYLVDQDDGTLLHIKHMDGTPANIAPFTNGGTVYATKLTYDADSVLLYITNPLTPQDPLTNTNYGVYRFTAFNQISSVSKNEVVVQKTYLTEDRMLELFRSDITFNNVVDNYDLDLLQSYIECDPKFFQGSANLAPSTGSLLGKTTKVIKLKLENYIDRADDYPSTTGRSTRNHPEIDIYTLESVFHGNIFSTNPLSVAIDKVLTWDEELILTANENRLVPTVFVGEQISRCNENCYTFNRSTFASTNKPTTPGVKTDFFVPNNLIIGGDGEITRDDGSYYKVDFEVHTVTVNIPWNSPGTEVYIDLVSDYLAIKNSEPCSGRTVMGFPAAKFADGTYADSAALSNDQLRFTVAIQSYFAQPDGYSSASSTPRLTSHIDYSTGVLALNFGDLFYQELDDTSHISINNGDITPAVNTLINRIQITAYLKKAGFQNRPLEISAKQMQNLLQMMGQGTTPIIGENTFTPGGDLQGTQVYQEVIGITGDSSGTVQIRDNVSKFQHQITSTDVSVEFGVASIPTKAASYSLSAQSNTVGDGGDLLITAGHCTGDGATDAGGDIVLQAGNKAGATVSSNGAVLTLGGGQNPGGIGSLRAGDGNPGGNIDLKSGDLLNPGTGYHSIGASATFGSGHNYADPTHSRSVILTTGTEYLSTTLVKSDATTFEMVPDRIGSNVAPSSGTTGKILLKTGGFEDIYGDWRREGAEFEMSSVDRDQLFPQPQSATIKSGYGHTSGYQIGLAGAIAYTAASLKLTGGTLDNSLPSSSVGAMVEAKSSDYYCEQALRSTGATVQATPATYASGGGFKVLCGYGPDGGDVELSAGQSIQSSNSASKLTLFGNNTTSGSYALLEGARQSGTFLKIGGYLNGSHIDLKAVGNLNLTGSTINFTGTIPQIKTTNYIETDGYLNVSNGATIDGDLYLNGVLYTPPGPSFDPDNADHVYTTSYLKTDGYTETNSLTVFDGASITGDLYINGALYTPPGPSQAFVGPLFVPGIKRTQYYQMTYNNDQYTVSTQTFTLNDSTSVVGLTMDNLVLDVYANTTQQQITVQLPLAVDCPGAEIQISSKQPGNDVEFDIQVQDTDSTNILFMSSTLGREIMSARLTSEGDVWRVLSAGTTEYTASPPVP